MNIFNFLKEKKQNHNVGFIANDKNVSKNLEVNIEELNSVFDASINQDFIVRGVDILSLRKKANAIFLSGLVDIKEIEQFVLKPLLEDNLLKDKKDIVKLISDCVPVKNIKIVTMISECIHGIVNGKTLLLLEDSKVGFLLDTTKIEHRNIDTPQNELVLKGTNEGFVESVPINKALIRKQLRYEKLITEDVVLNNRASNTVSLMYVSNLVDNDVVKEVKNRLQSIEVDSVQDIALLEQYLEEKPYSLVPTILYTERPDRAVSFMLEGHVVILAENSPACLIAPVTFWSFFHTAEDSYQRWAYGNFLRFIRLISFFIAIIIPAFYVAATNYHIEMIPTDLALAIAAKRETVPFPAVFEVLIMEIAFEILREAGVRVPTPIGPTIGIVGALILGQAAVEANIISPIMVIVVAVTGLSSFAIPDISFSLMIRMVRFVFLFAAALFGLLGIVVSLTLSIAYLTTLTSFKVPFLAPMAPYNPSSKDLLFRRTVKKQYLRPAHLSQQDSKRK